MLAWLSRGQMANRQTGGFIVRVDNTYAILTKMTIYDRITNE